MRKRITPALVLSVVAVILAVSGTATAASLITSKQIKDGTVTGRDVKNRSLSPADFSGSVRGPQGPAGPAGTTGPAGPTGATGVASIVSTNASDIGGAFTYCPAGTRVVSGGGVDVSDTGHLWLSAAVKDDATGRTGWAAGGDGETIAVAYCSSGVSSFTFPDGTVRSATSSTPVLTPQQFEALKAKRTH